MSKPDPSNLPRHSADGDGARTKLPGATRPSLPEHHPAQFRLGLISLFAAVIGLLAGGVAYILYRLIGLFTNIFFFHRFNDQFTSARLNHLGPWVIVTPVIGGLIVGLLA